VKTVTFLGIEGEPAITAVQVGDLVLGKGQPGFVGDEQLVALNLSPFGTETIDVHETTVCEYLGRDVSYDGSLAEMDITAVIPNYETPDPIRQAVTTLKRHYPDLQLIVVDDGSHDDSTEYIVSLPDRFTDTHSVISSANVGHGAALHLGLCEVHTKRVFTMDSDVIVRKGGFLELMESRMIACGLYGVGIIYWRDWRNEYPYLTCVAAMYDMETYRSLPPFRHAGDPMDENMAAAFKAGYKVEPFPMMRYVKHLECGTRRHFGYRWDMTGG